MTPPTKISEVSQEFFLSLPENGSVIHVKEELRPHKRPVISGYEKAKAERMAISLIGHLPY